MRLVDMIMILESITVIHAHVGYVDVCAFTSRISS